MTRWATIAAAIVAMLHAALAVIATREKSVTADEILHLTGGYFYNRYGDFRIQPENGVLPQRWAALPAVLMGAPPPPLENNVYWRTSDASVVGYQFFYETKHDHWPMLMAGRAMIAVFSAATAFLVFCWARTLFGLGAGFFSLGLYALCPNHLAHGALVTSDAAAIFFLLASVGAFWRHLRVPSAVNLILSAVVFGLACVAKFSAVLLIPIFVLLLAWYHATRRGRGEPTARPASAAIALTTGVHAAAAVFIIWTFYGFRFTAFAAEVPAAAHFVVPWDRVLPTVGWQGVVIDALRTWKLLPEAFLYGYTWVLESAQARSAYLAGDYSLTGWVSFFPLAFLWKTPLPVVGVLVLGIVTLLLRWKRWPSQWRPDMFVAAPLLVFFLVYWGASLTSNLNIGHRHILPTYPVLFILVGGLAASGVLPHWLAVAVPAVALGGQALANARTAPHYLAFFNSFAGGPSNGWRLLVDSSLDWGQDLPGLKRWLDRHVREEPVYLAYFGSGEPDYYRIKARRLPFINGFKLQQRYERLEPGVYAASATMLVDVYSPTRGPWTLDREKEFQQLHALEPQFAAYWKSPDERRALEREIPSAQWDALQARYSRLRFSRLSHYLRARPADASVGHSILIFRLTAQEIDAAAASSLSQWQTAIERAVASRQR